MKHFGCGLLERGFAAVPSDCPKDSHSPRQGEPDLAGVGMDSGAEPLFGQRGSRLMEPATGGSSGAACSHKAGEGGGVPGQDGGEKEGC